MEKKNRLSIYRKTILRGKKTDKKSDDKNLTADEVKLNKKYRFKYKYKRRKKDK